MCMCKYLNYINQFFAQFLTTVVSSRIYNYYRWGIYSGGKRLQIIIKLYLCATGSEIGGQNLS